MGYRVLKHKSGWTAGAAEAGRRVKGGPPSEQFISHSANYHLRPSLYSVVQHS